MTRPNTLSRRLPSIVVLTLPAVLILTACSGRVLPEPATPEPTAVAGMANPASVFCEEQGGRLEIRTAADGSQAGACVFPDGSECDEWAFFRGECRPGSATPSPTTTPEQAGDTGPAATPETASIEPAATLQASLPDGAFEGTAAIALTAPAGSPPLWAAYTTGLRNFDLDPVPGHVVAIFTQGDTGWQELARLDLNATPITGGDQLIDSGPDYVDPQGVRQVEIDPTRTWLTIDGGAGAHSGTFQLLSFDGQALRQEVGGFSASPGAGSIADVNGDGQNDAVLNATDPYIFTYASGMTHPYFEVYTWLGDSMVPVEISDLKESDQGQLFYEANKEAVALAGAGLWPDALAKIEEAVQLAEGSDPPAPLGSLRWNEALIRLNFEAHQKARASSPYPLLSYVFAGDYAGAVDQMRSYSLEQIFTPQSPLIAGTVAEGWEDAVSNYILDSANAALAVQPELGPAYFLRAWAEFLASPGSRQVNADLHRAAELAPDDPLFAAGATLNIAPEPTAAAAEARAQREATRIQFAPGATSATAGGALVSGGSQRYVLQALAGQTMDVALITRAGDARLEVSGADGTVLKAATDASQSWQGSLPTSQDYIITLTGGATGAPYQLRVTIPPLTG